MRGVDGVRIWILQVRAVLDHQGRHTAVHPCRAGYMRSHLSAFRNLVDKQEALAIIIELNRK